MVILNCVKLVMGFVMPVSIKPIALSANLIFFRMDSVSGLLSVQKALMQIFPH